MNPIIELLIENGVKIVATLLITLIGVLGTWLTLKIGKREELKSIAAATGEVTDAAHTVVMSLQQTTVEAMKAACEDGKLTESEIEELNALLLEKALAEISEPAKNLLIAAGKDINAMILDAGEALIGRMK